MTVTGIVADLVEARGAKFYCRPGTSDEKSVAEAFTRRGYERRGFRVEMGETWVDLGANIGAFSVFAHVRGAEVTSFEPHAGNAELCRRNLELNGADPSAVVQAAVANVQRRGKASLHLGTDYGQWRHSLVQERGHGDHTVTVLPFAKTIEGADGVKMDIEGSEIEILAARQDWGTVSKLVFEWHFDTEPRVSVFREAVALLEMDFDVRHRTIGADVETYNHFPPCIVVYCTRRTK